MEEEENNTTHKAEDQQFLYMMSPEIIEIGEGSKSFTQSRDGGNNNVYVAVGRDDLHVLKWALNHAVVPGSSCIFLIHVFPPVNYIPTPGPSHRFMEMEKHNSFFDPKIGTGIMEVGRISKSQVSKEQVKTYLRDENARRRNLLQKYIRLCNDAKVTVDTILIESNLTAKAILELIPVLNITMLVLGTKITFLRRLKKGLGKGEYVQKNAPDFCEVTIIFNGKKVSEEQQVGPESPSAAPSGQQAGMSQHTERNFFYCSCFTGKLD